MKKIFWTSLNPTEKFKRFVHMLCFLLLAVLIVLLKLYFMDALLITGVMLACSYVEYKKLKKNALEFEENKQKG